MPLFSIIMINILLSGDNALVIALVSRKLTPEQQKVVMLFGSGGAIVLRIGLIFLAVLILTIPYLQMISGVLLLWIAIKLLADGRHHQNLEAKKNVWDAIKTIIIADVVMSLDNVIAIIGIVQGKISLLIMGIIISIPIIIWGSRFIGILIQKWPAIIIAGSVFLGWTAGKMVIGDKVITLFIEQQYWLEWFIPTIFSVVVLLRAMFVSKKRKKTKKKN